MVASVWMRRGLGRLVCKVSETGFCVSTPKGPDGLIDDKATGQPPNLKDGQRQALARLVESGPIPSIHGVVRWRRKDLAQWIFEEFRISVDETTVGRELKALGFVKISVLYQLAKRIIVTPTQVVRLT